MTDVEKERLEAVAYQTRVIIQTEQLRPFISPIQTKTKAGKNLSHSWRRPLLVV